MMGKCIMCHLGIAVKKIQDFFFVNLYCLQFWTSVIIMLAILFFFSTLEMQNLNLYYFSYN